MQKGYPLIAILLIVSFLGSCLLPIQAEAASKLNNIQQVKVFLQVLGEEPSKELKQRIDTSVQRVSAKALQGQDINHVLQSKEYLEFTIQKVFDRVLTGYQVGKVTIKPAAVTKVYLDLVPVGQIVETVELVIIPENVPPAFQELINQQQPKLQEMANKALKGLPIDTMSWSQLALEPLLEKMVSKYLVGFKAGIDFQWGKNTKIVLSLRPEGPTIRNIEVNLSSQSFPKTFLRDWNTKIGKEVAVLKGLPVAFVEAHLPEMHERLQEEIEDNPVVKKYGLILNPQVELGETTKINLGVESTKYIIGLQASLGLGSKAPHESEAKAHLGTFLNSHQELFLETAFYPNPIKLEWSTGWSYKFNDKYKLGYRYNFTEGENYLFFDHGVKNGLVKVERNLTKQISEISYTHPLDEHFSLSLVGNSQGDTWLIFTGHL